jgi:DNA-binding GntR family transcriptional regulator
VSRFNRIDSQPARLADRVYEQLLQAILNGSVRPGERLIQEQLADEINVSRTPVREALLRLEREGIIAPSGRRGFEVQELTSQMVADCYQAREAIEGYAARLVAERADASMLARLEETLLTEGAAKPTVESAYEANRRAHRAVVESTGNQYLIDMFDAIWSRAIALRMYADLYASRIGSAPVAHTHRDLWQALASGNGDRASEAMVSHIRAGLDQQLEALSVHVR